MLLCHGYYALASDSYFEAMHNGAGTEEGMVLGAMGSGRSCGTLWPELRRSVLFKILYCASALRCKLTCIKAALLLHASNCVPVEPDFSTTDLSNISSQDKIVPIGVGISRDNEGAVRAFLPYFEIETESAVVREEPSKLILSSGGSSSSSSSSRAAEADVRGRVDVSSEGHYSICLNLLSRFPCSVELDEVCIIYEAAPTLVGRDSSIEGTTEDGMRMSNPQCFAAACLTMGSNEAITLHPGVAQALTFPFAAPSHCHSHDCYSVVQVKAIVRGGQAQHAAVGGEVAGSLGAKTISFVHKNAQYSGDSSSSKELSQQSTRSSVSNSYPELQGSEHPLATRCFMSSLPAICVKRVSQSSSVLSLALGAVEVEHALVDGAGAMTARATDDGGLMQRQGTDREKVGTCPIKASIAAPLITSSSTPPQPTSATSSEPFAQCPLHAHSQDFLAKIKLNNTSLKAVRIAGVDLCHSDFDLSEISEVPSCVCIAKTSCSVRLTRTWNSVVLLPGESYSAILYCKFISKIASTDVAYAASLVSVQCDEGEEGATVSKGGETSLPYLLFSCQVEDVPISSPMPSLGHQSRQQTNNFPNLVVCLQSTCRSIIRVLWHTVVTDGGGEKDSSNPSALNPTRKISSRGHGVQVQGFKMVEGAAACAQSFRRHHERDAASLATAAAAAENFHARRQRVLTKAVKTDRLLSYFPSSW